MTQSPSAEGGEAADLDVYGAVERIEKALAYDAPLRTRGEGLSWIVWGLVTAVVVMAERGLTDWSYREWYAVVLPAWAILGIVGTAAVWRLAGIARPALSPSLAKVAVGVAAALVALVGMSAIGWTMFEVSGSYAVLALAMAAVPWGLLGWVQWTRLTRAGRRMTVALGLVMSLLLVTFIEFVRTDSMSDADSVMVMVAIIGGIPFLVGLAWTFRR